MTQNYLFFTASRSVTDRLGELCNFVWAGAVAMWSLRQQVQGFIAESAIQSRTEAELHDRFVKPSGVTSADLRTTCLKWSWETQQEQFAKILLFDLCGLYEAWLEDVVPRAMPAGTGKRKLGDIQNGLQFPTSIDAQGNICEGLKWAIQTVNQRPSAFLKQDIFPILVKHKKNAWPLIENMLAAYRYFKECRNALIHKGSIADHRVVDAYHVLQKLHPSDIGLHGSMKLPPIVSGQMVRLALPDVVGFSSIIHTMIVTLDAALAVSEGSEMDMLDRIRDKQHGRLLPKQGSANVTQQLLPYSERLGSLSLCACQGSKLC